MQFAHTADEFAPTSAEYVPAVQLTHAVAPASTEYLPAVQLTHALAPAAPEYAPASQLTHAAEEFAPVSAEYVPATQLTHALAPAAAYVPTGHKAHTLVLVAPVAFEYSPAAQFKHGLDPVTALYCPAAHVTHTPPFCPENPASQVQLTRNPLKTPAREFDGHKLQLGLPSGDHRPSAQLTHVSFPTAP